MCMADYNDEGALFYVERTRAARKDHRCGECGRVIGCGEMYRHAKAMWRGDSKPSEFRQCPHCAVAADLLVRHCNGWLFHGVEEDLAEHINEALPWSREAARMVVGMRRQWKSFARPGLLPVPKLSSEKEAA